MHSHQIHDLLPNDLLTGLATHIHNRVRNTFLVGAPKTNKY